MYRRSQIVEKYIKNQPEVNRAVVAKYTKNNRQVNKDAVARYDPSRKKRTEHNKRSWTESANAGFDYNADVTYELDKTVQQGSISVVKLLSGKTKLLECVAVMLKLYIIKISVFTILCLAVTILQKIMVDMIVKV